MTDNTNLVNEIRLLMEKNKWTQTELAHAIGVSFLSVNRWFNGHQKMDDKTALWVRSRMGENHEMR